MISKLDWSLLNSSIDKYRKNYKLETDSQAFSYFVLEKLFPSYENDIGDLLTEGGNDCGVDALKIDQHGDTLHVHIFQFKFYNSYKKSEKNFAKKEADKIISFVDRVFDEDSTLEKTTNPYLWEKIQRIWEVYKYAGTKFTVYFCSNGKALQEGQGKIVSNALSRYKISFEELPFRKILDLIITPNKKSTTHSFQALEKQYMGRSDGDIRGLIASISAKDLISIIQDPNDKNRINSEVFDQNIRVFLGKDNPVNDSIINTALSEKSTYFWYLNNGITAVCSELLYRDGIRSPNIEVKNLQILNGAQTSCALFEAAKQNQNVLDDVVVLIRIYETKNQELPYEIAVATNSQTRIFSRDLMSNSETQIKLEEAFKNVGYFYERKKHQYQDHDASRRIDALKLGQIILSYYLREPEKSKTDSDKIFGSRYEEIFNTKYEVHSLLDVYLIFQKVEKLRQATNALKKKGPVVAIDSFLTYGQFHMLYLVSLIAEKTNIDASIERNQDRLINDALKKLREYVMNRKSYSFYNLFRNPKTKFELYDLVMYEGQLELELEDFSQRNNV